PVGNYVGRHGRPTRTITAIDFLNHALAPIATRQININIGPAFASFAQKTFEEGIELEWVHRRDAQTKTNRAVGRAPPPLRHDFVLATKADNVRDNQEITGETKFRDQGEFPLDLAQRFVWKVAAVSPARSGQCLLAQ